MEEFGLIPVALLSLILLWKIYFFNSPAKTKRLPPSPPKLPIIGNLHQLGRLPHRDLHALDRKHGPIMLLHFGTFPVLIVSSPDWAREVMRTHDLDFATRPRFKAFRKMLYDCNDISTSPYGDHWRKMKSLLVLQLLNTKRVQLSRLLLQEETALLIDTLRASAGAGPVDLSAMFAKFNNDAICRSAFGRTYSESENGKKFLRLMSIYIELLGNLDIGDFIPWLGWIGRVNGVDKRIEGVVKEMDQVLECVVEERLQGNREMKGESFIDLIIDIYRGGNDNDLSIDRDSIKPIVLDIFLAGTDTSSTVLEWTMAELLRNPSVMERLQREVRGIGKQKQNITSDDLENMHYLKAVIKEDLRLHTPLPLLMPRVARRDVQINGYDVSAGTVVMINAWSIGRDPAYWDEPEKFKPERFLNSSIDFRSMDFELIPFGAGRRGCPGITLAIATIELALANLILNFDWKLVDVNASDLDMGEAPGVTIRKAIPLLAVPSQVE